MANNHFRNILLYIILQAVFCIHAMKRSSEVAVEGDRIEMECITNSSFGVDWKFNNGANEYKLYIDGVVPDNIFKMDYSVKNVDFSSYKISYLSIARVKRSNVGTYICLNDEHHQQILTSVDLALLTIPICEPDTKSTETMRRFACNFTFMRDIFPRSEWSGDFCTNSTPTVCSEATEGNLSCEFPINKRNRNFLPFATNLLSHGIEVCEISCKNWVVLSEEISTDGFRTISLNTSIQISVLLQCSMKSTTTQTLTRSHEPTDSIANSSTPCITLTIVIVILGITNVASITVCLVVILKRKKVLIDMSEGTSSAYRGLSRETPLPGSEYTELQEDQMHGQHPVHASQDTAMTMYMELIE